MLCKKNGGYIAIIIGVLVAFYVANKSHAESVESLDVKTEGKGATVIFISELNGIANMLNETSIDIKTSALVSGA